MLGSLRSGTTLPRSLIVDNDAAASRIWSRSAAAACGAPSATWEMAASSSRLAPRLQTTRRRREPTSVAIPEQPAREKSYAPRPHRRRRDRWTAPRRGDTAHHRASNHQAGAPRGLELALLSSQVGSPAERSVGPVVPLSTPVGRSPRSERGGRPAPQLEEHSLPRPCEPHG